MFVSRVDMRGGRRFQIRRGRMSMGFYLISFFFWVWLAGIDQSVSSGKNGPAGHHHGWSWGFLFWSLLLKFHSPIEREKEWKREEAIDQPLTLSKLNKSSKVLSLSLSPVCLALLLPISWFPPLKLSCVLLLSTLQLSSSTTTTYRRPSDPSTILCSGFYQLHCCRLLSLFTKR